MGMPIEGFFDGLDVVAEAMASTSVAAAQGAPVEASVPPSKPIPAEESTQTERAVSSRIAPIPVEIPTP